MNRRRQHDEGPIPGHTLIEALRRHPRNAVRCRECHRLVVPGSMPPIWSVCGTCEDPGFWERHPRLTGCLQTLFVVAALVGWGLAVRAVLVHVQGGTHTQIVNPGASYEVAP